MEVWPSIASSDQACLQQEIAKLNNYHHIHFDIEDGNFVPNITFGMKTIRRVRELTDAAFDCHLMVTDPLAYIQDLAALRFETVCFHWEAAPYPSQIIGAIRSYGMKAGNPVWRVFIHREKERAMPATSCPPPWTGS